MLNSMVEVEKVEWLNTFGYDISVDGVEGRKKFNGFLYEYSRMEIFIISPTFSKQYIV